MRSNRIRDHATPIARVEMIVVRCRVGCIIVSYRTRPEKLATFSKRADFTRRVNRARARELRDDDVRNRRDDSPPIDYG